MRTAIALCVAVLLVTPAHGQQTEEQKLLFERAKKKLIDEAGGGYPQAVVYLVKRRAGIPFVEDAIISFRKEKPKITERWIICMHSYATHVMPEDVPDRMIPEFIAELELHKKDQTIFFHIPKIVEFGTRAKAAIPTLEWIRDNAAEERAALAAAEAIRKIKGQ